MNKQKKLKLILSSFKQKQLLKFFDIFLQAINSKFYKSVKQISFSCYESTCQLQNLMVNGYGKTSSEALISGINNIIDCLLEDEDNCEVLRKCLKRMNVSTVDSGGAQMHSSSKKNFLCHQNSAKTEQKSATMSVEKKLLTMSGKGSSQGSSNSKGKTIKDEIFEYFNLENLKVKNPNDIVAFPSKPKHPVSNFNISGIEKDSKQRLSISKEKKDFTFSKGAFPSDSYQLSVVEKQILEVQAKIKEAEQRNCDLKAKIKKQQQQQKTVKNQRSFEAEFISRPSFDIKKDKKILQSSSSKKLHQQNFESIGLSKKFITQFSEEHESQKQVERRHSILKNKVTNENKGAKQQTAQGKLDTSMRKCLVDISNIGSQVTVDNSAFSTAGCHKKGTDSSVNNGLFATASINPKPGSACGGMSAAKAMNMESKKFQDALEDRERKRSFSMAKHGSHMTMGANLIANLNSSFDGGAKAEPSNAKKIQIPKLNLQVLPNYHGNSNKSLNQALMDNYEKKVKC